MLFSAHSARSAVKSFLGRSTIYNLRMITLLLLTLFQTPAQTEMPAIPKFLQVTPQFCTGAQPRLEARSEEHTSELKSR